MTNKQRTMSYFAIREMVRFHPTFGQHTLLVQSVYIMQRIAFGFTINDVIELLNQAENDLHITRG